MAPFFQRVPADKVQDVDFEAHKSDGEIKKSLVKETIQFSCLQDHIVLVKS